MSHTHFRVQNILIWLHAKKSWACCVENIGIWPLLCTFAQDWPPRHERCEDPVYAKEKGLTLDLEYYLLNQVVLRLFICICWVQLCDLWLSFAQLKTPLLSLLEPIYPEAIQIFQETESKNQSVICACLDSFLIHKLCGVLKTVKKDWSSQFDLFTYCMHKFVINYCIFLCDALMMSK